MGNKIRGRLYFRKLEVVGDDNVAIYKVRDVPLSIGLTKLFEMIEHKDSPKALKNILMKFSHYLDDDFKKLFGMEEKKNGK